MEEIIKLILKEHGSLTKDELDKLVLDEAHRVLQDLCIYTQAKRGAHRVRVYKLKQQKSFRELYPDRCTESGGVCKPRLSTCSLCEDCPGYDQCKACNRGKQLKMDQLVIN